MSLSVRTAADAPAGGDAELVQAYLSHVRVEKRLADRTVGAVHA